MWVGKLPPDGIEVNHHLTGGSNLIQIAPMTHGRILASVAAFGIAVAAGWSAAAGAQQGGSVAAPFTDAQANAGQTGYAQACASCHGATLAGGGEAPPLVGTIFIDSWGTRTTRDLLAQTRASMPPENPNGLSADAYAAIVAFLLKANGAQPGAAELTATTNVQIASIATGQVPAGVFASAGSGRRGGRGSDDDSAEPSTPRS